MASRCPLPHPVNELQCITPSASLRLQDEVNPIDPNPKQLVSCCLLTGEILGLHKQVLIDKLAVPSKISARLTNRLRTAERRMSD